jgi:ABC-2 type transport system permease protein
MSSHPDGSLLAVLSVIPMFSPVLMPMRIATGAAAGWEIGLAIALTVVLLAAMIRLSGMVYRNSVLRTGARVRLSEALRPA